MNWRQNRTWGKNVKKAIYEGSGMALQEGLMVEELFFEAMRSDNALQIMKFFLEVGQDRKKLAELMAAENKEELK